ncbi:MAG: coproporphyrinogen III oxidase, partial [Gammaproteobacteria bacterium]
RLPVWRGKVLTQDDKIRRAAIMQLICHFELDMHAFSEAHNIDFETYFDDALAQLKQMEVDGLVTISDHRIKINDIGRLLVRNVCMPFDKYLQRMREQISFSKTI